MKLYFKFLKEYYRLHKMQFLGPLFTLTIICFILFGSISVNKLISEQTESYFYDQYGKVTQIIKPQNKVLYSEKDFKSSITGKNKTAYIQNNGVYNQDKKVTFINLYGIDASFYQAFPINDYYELKGNEIMISSAFSKKNGLKKTDLLNVEIQGQSFEFQIKKITDGDFFAKEESQGPIILASKEQVRQNSQVADKLVTTLAGTDLKIQKNKNDYQVDNVRENVSATAQIQMIHLVVILIDTIIILVATYILFGFYRMAFMGKLHYSSILTIIGIKKRRLIGLLWIENIVLMSLIYLVLSIISMCILPLGWIYYIAIYALLLLTVVVANLFITKLFLKTNALAYILGREQNKQKKGWEVILLLGFFLIAACLIAPTISTFILVCVTLLFSLYWMLGKSKKSSIQLIKQLNRERIVNEMKAILILALVSLLLIYAAVTGVQNFITGVYNNWNFDQQVTARQEATADIQKFLDENKVEYNQFLWKNYAIDPLNSKLIVIDDLIGITSQDDLESFTIKSNIDIKQLKEANTIYLNSSYKKNKINKVTLEGISFKVIGYFESNMSATGNVAIVSERNFRKLNDSEISQFYITNDDKILTKLYGEFGDDILGNLDARQQRIDNVIFAQNLQNILMIFILFIALISILSLLNSFFILRDKQKKLFAILGAAGLSKKKLMSLNLWQVVAIGLQSLLIAEVILILVLQLFEWFIQFVIGQNILLIATSKMQFQSISVFVCVLVIVWLASRQTLKKMNILETIRER